MRRGISEEIPPRVIQSAWLRVVNHQTAFAKETTVETFQRTVASLILVVALGSAAAFAQEKSLYQRLGGYDAIAAVSDEFISRLATDDQEKRFFVGFSSDSKTHIRQLFVDLVCKVTGGPCAYVGRDMKTAHAGIGITKADWDHSLKIFGEVLSKFKVGDKEQQDLAALLGPLEKDIVEK
jgi:hemoglobin